ncbi:DUF3644 domain-containing protein [Aureivirga marina]|uniref:DUF3644 domain-containing protein n=1 Tax=Aureivirga marina TaxID=1182451 RepID=UPI0018CA2884|nr:DUF3644 domain-containing protein [Aureivirga marina]
MKPISEALIENSKSAIIGCIELHNKPIFSYRYEICTVLCINGWELILKAFINENLDEFKLIKKDGTTKTFEECLSYVSQNIGKEFMHIEENLKKLYEFRCHIIHFYKENLDAVLYSVLHKSILNYNDFLKGNFNTDLSQETHLMLLPLGFKPFISPVDFLSDESAISQSSKSIQAFIKSIVSSTELLNDAGIKDSIFSSFKIAAVNESRISNADIIAGITKDHSKAKLAVNAINQPVNITDEESAKKIRIEEDSLFKTIYTLKYNDITQKAREMYSDFKQNPKFNRIMKGIKENPNLRRKRYLDVVNKSGTGQDFYSTEVFTELNKYYKLKEE